MPPGVSTESAIRQADLPHLMLALPGWKYLKYLRVGSSSGK